MISKGSSVNPESKGSNSSDVIGTWNAFSADVGISLTTNSDQQALDFISQAAGSIAITGAHQTILNYLLVLNLGSVRILEVTNQFFIPEFLNKAVEYPVYRLELADLGVVGSAQFIAEFSDTEIENFIGNYNNFIYDPNAFRITVENAELFKDDFTASETAAGILTAQSTSVPANISTVVLSLPISLDDEGCMTLNQDGTFIATILFEGENDTINGTWETADSNQLRFVATIETETGPRTDTLTVAYTVTPENLMLTLEEDPADYIDELAGWTEEEFLRVVELVFGLQPGSLNKVMVTATLTLLKTTSPSTSFPKAKSNWTMKSCSRKFTSLFIEKVKNVQQKIPHR